MIELRVKGRVLRHYANVDVTLSLDTIASTFSFQGFLDINNELSRDLFKPFSYHECQVWYVDKQLGINQKLLTGTILNPALSVQRQIQLSSLSGYSKTGVLEDVSMPQELYPLQKDGLGLDQITKQITDYFGLKLYIFPNARKDAAKKLEKSKATPSQKIKEYLSNIARDRNITIAHDNRGRLLLYKVLAQIPPAVKINESDETLKISVSPNGQGVHSDITVIKQASKTDSNAGQTTIKSPFLPSGIKRPITQTLRSGDIYDTKGMAEAIASREAKAFPITIQKEGWTIQGKLIRSGFYIELTAPSIFIETTKLVVEKINFKNDPQKGQTMTITAVLPCVYTGKLPSKSPFK